MINKNAFTFMETAIVIFIITTLFGIIFFVKKTAKESDIKSLVMQIKKYDAALNSFTQKYHALPGDVVGTVTYGITETNTDGDGDNVITDYNKKILQANGEIVNFWMHLSKSKMLDENYNGAENENAKTGNTFPTSKIGEKIGIVAFGAEGKTFYQIGFIFSNIDRLYTNNNSLTTKEALMFDKKIDDGNPQKGRVMSAGFNTLNILENDKCVKFGEYDQNALGPVCQLRIEAK
ncbi:MAG: hypothetical protein A3G22_00860 [Alphaproteobacteria bacterium RIFCSPLOWO2_12_FULL_40_11]|nr:MAG: hypothetical protein A3G22_00860 [Alphaproteobacteria bacterium RIFCSPLOWO2_12_FULL_40_11]